MSRSTTAAAVLAVIATSLGGCGSDDVFRTSRPILRMTVDEYRIVPQNAEVEAGRMKFVVRNTGRLTHNLVVQDEAADPDSPPVTIAKVDTMQPGQTAPPVKVTLAPGEYRLVCTIANHDDLGQFGTLKVDG